MTVTSTSYDALATHPITEVKTSLPGPARARRDRTSATRHVSPSLLIHCYPLYVKRAAGAMVQDLDDNVLLDCEAGRRRHGLDRLAVTPTWRQQ